jgi:hypothetical protein
METKMEKYLKNEIALNECLKRNNLIKDSIPKNVYDSLIQNAQMNRSFMNWLEKIPPTPSYLSGPFTLTKHTHSANEENGWISNFYVYVFGERHGEKGCDEWNDFLKQRGSEKRIKIESKIMGIHDFLREIADTSPVFLDIFIEMERKSRRKERELEERGMEYVHRYNIGKIREIFEGRMSYIDDKNIEFEHMENVRVHAIDERTRHIGGFLDEFYNTNFSKESLKNALIAEKFINTIQMQLSVKDSEEFIKKFYMNDRLIEKEFGRLNDKYKKIIFDYITDSWREENFEIFTKSKEYIMDYRNIEDYLNVEKMFELYDKFYHVAVSLMGMHVDIYFLSRFLKGFNSETRTRFPYNSIVYAGDIHSQNYRKFLTKLGFTEESLAIDDFISGATYLLRTDKEVVIKNMEKDGTFTMRSAGCLHVDEKKAYPMFDVEKM